ncbi:carboxymuconolactone decarboxylase family protein [Actinomycetospora termitidis]|uniref:Carboxymuconolactone decarboxylase family protein n=1 Tax=Actinomycetospora termitidis TaxID=3053470 RepID=A0ABT7MG58_9PSEU|nr:carboxymuconolactone decarboxylase family protein [Actinomycetospora sp. Odt1-22]MDL5159661.1 carboxymuconolactone decarboxylase family protein [Actinomycetospora sp. Odt1-22]
MPLVDAEGRLLGPFALMLLAPGVGSAVQQVGATLRTGTELSSLGRELAILTVAAHQRSAFEWEAHEHAARQAGADSAQLQAVLDGAVPDGLPEVETCVARTARTLVTLQTLPDDDYDRAVATLGTACVAELVWLVGYYAMLALALAALRPGST